MDKRTEMLKQLILVKYKNIREFANEINIPYTTILTMLKRGISGTGIDIIINVCHALGISVDDLAFEHYDNILTPEFQILIENAKHLTPEQLQKLNDFIDTLKNN